MLAGILKLIECGFEFDLDFEWDFMKDLVRLRVKLFFKKIIIITMKLK